MTKLVKVIDEATFNKSAVSSKNFGSLPEPGEFNFSYRQTTVNTAGEFAVFVVNGTTVTIRVGDLRKMGELTPKLLIVKDGEVFINTIDFKIKGNPKVTGFVSVKKEVPEEQTA